MAAESIYGKRRPGFPKKSTDSGSYRTYIEYTGLQTALIAAAPDTGDAWGDYLGSVTVSDLEPIENTVYAILSITCELQFGGSGAEMGDGEKKASIAEIDWVDVQRSMYEHPEFTINGAGAYKLTSKDISEIKLWQAEGDSELAKDYKFTIKSASGSNTESTLSNNAKMFARGLEQGIEFFVDKAPVARLSESYVGGPGPTSVAGQKDTPDGIPNLPTGYEWVRSADRSLQQGDRSKWQRDIEWTGAEKVLADSKNIYWSPP